MAIDKVFIYLVRRHAGTHQLLLFRSHDEPGFEVPKGSVDPGESILEAGRRELLEESGISAVRIVSVLATADWRNERQHFLLAETESARADSFKHVVTGTGVDCGLLYEFEWHTLSTELERALVQGCGQAVRELTQRLEDPPSRVSSAP